MAERKFSKDYIKFGFTSILNKEKACVKHQHLDACGALQQECQTLVKSSYAASLKPLQSKLNHIQLVRPLSSLVL